jgi:hypothetical protein
VLVVAGLGVIGPDLDQPGGRLGAYGLARVVGVQSAMAELRVAGGRSSLWSGRLKMHCRPGELAVDGLGGPAARREPVPTMGQWR